MRNVAGLDDVFARLGRQPVITIVQVGANDGRINDPIFDFVQRHRAATRLLLIEPQPEIIPHLRDSYRDHPAAAIACCAIAPASPLVLHRVRPALWPEYRVGYLPDAPAYRAPSGVASASRQHVIDHARPALNRAVENCVESIEVPARRLGSFAAEWPHLDAIDLLQIDTEGEDDVTLSACDLATLRPRFINYEYRHLDDDRRRRLVQMLTALGYRVRPWSRYDCLAVLYPPGVRGALQRWFGGIRFSPAAPRG